MAIYRITIGDDPVVRTSMPTQIVLSREGLEPVLKLLPLAARLRIESLADRLFFHPDQFFKALRSAISPAEFARHSCEIWRTAEKSPPDTRKERAMRGAGSGETGAMMERMGLRGPSVRSRRARFYFTEAGWRRFGRQIAAEAGRLGFVVRVEKRKEPRRSQVIYRDQFQLALLPSQSAAQRDLRTLGRARKMSARRAARLEGDAR